MQLSVFIKEKLLVYALNVLKFYINLTFNFFYTVTIYTQQACPYCVQAKSLLSSLGVEFEEIDVTNTPDKKAELAEISGMTTMPQIFVGEKCLGGYSDIAALHEKGELMSNINEVT